jgi:hypothetical protein
MGVQSILEFGIKFGIALAMIGVVLALMPGIWNRAVLDELYDSAIQQARGAQHEKRAEQLNQKRKAIDRLPTYGCLLLIIGVGVALSACAAMATIVMK